VDGSELMLGKLSPLGMEGVVGGGREEHAAEETDANSLVMSVWIGELQKKGVFWGVRPMIGLESGMLTGQ
jgi:hypothetical protein